MPRDHGRNDERARIAHLAARLMAEEGLEDYGRAKRKAARQAGVPDSRQLPDNSEIDAALRTFHALYQPREHEQRLLELRATALDIMHTFNEFNPYLTGLVLTGMAGRYAGINLQLYTDNAKGVEMFLMDRRIPYHSGKSRLLCGESWRDIPMFMLEENGVDVELLVFDARDARFPVRTSAHGRPMERAKIHAVEVMLEQSSATAAPGPMS